MNEPHDLDITEWATSVQEAVTSIRTAGATSNLILLPGTGYTNAGGFSSDGSGDALISVVNNDGTTDNLIFDVHQYLDSDASGTSTECTSDGTSGLTTLATWLRSVDRQALLSETGGGNTDSCVTDLCAQFDFMK